MIIISTSSAGGCTRQKCTWAELVTFSPMARHGAQRDAATRSPARLETAAPSALFHSEESRMQIVHLITDLALLVAAFSVVSAICALLYVTGDAL